MKRTLITSALPYINGVKHLGNLIGSLLPADAYARFLRQQGEEVLFVCGTDEHGTPAEIGAAECGMPVRKYCELQYLRQRDIYDRFEISFDYFGRSSSPTNVQTTQEIFHALWRKGLILEKDVELFYSVTDQRFLPDRYVVGTCPVCNFSDARGDQCDNCGTLLDAVDLINPRSAISGSYNVELKKSKHLFLDLEKLAPKIETWLASHQDWPSTVTGIGKKWLREGLRPRSITRDLSWGVPVPMEGYEGKVFYVWFDAPIAYISITKDWAKLMGKPDEWLRWWREPAEVRLVQFMAKDNVPFHTVFWPAMMMSVDDRWLLADYIKGFNWLTYAGGKFSTSRRRGVFTDVALELFPADYWRYSLLAIAPESDDSDFSFQTFASHVNKDLAGTLGNFVSRVGALIQKMFDGRLPSGFVVDSALNASITEKVQLFEHEMRALKFRQAMSVMRSMWVLGNEYITVEQPWRAGDSAKIANVLKNCLYLQRIFSSVCASTMPVISKRIQQTICPDAPSELSLRNSLDIDWLRGEVSVPPAGVLISRIDPEQVESLTRRFAGTEVTDRK